MNKINFDSAKINFDFIHRFADIQTIETRKDIEVRSGIDIKTNDLLTITDKIKTRFGVLTFDLVTLKPN